MTYRHEMARVGAAVGRLLTDGGTVPRDDVPAALAGHLALVELLATVHHDLAPAPLTVRDSIEALETDPVAILGSKLRDHPRQFDQPISSVLAVDAVSDAGRAWRQVAAAATLAQHDWQTANTFSWPRGETAWSEMADVAALSQAVAVLDRDIADSLASLDRFGEASVYRAASRSGLGISAAAVKAMAAGGSLPVATELVPKATRKVIAVLRPADVAAALIRLGHLTATSTDIPPAHVALAGRAVAESSLAAAAILETAGHHGMAAALQDQASRLAAASSGARQVAGLHPGDGRALSQANAIHQFLTGMRDRGQHLSPDVASRIAVAISGASAGLKEAADQQVASGRWLVKCFKGRQAGEWGRVRGNWEAPRLQTALPTATPHPAAPGPAVARVDTPRTQLAEALDRAAVSRVVRPPIASPVPGRPR